MEGEGGVRMLGILRSGGGGGGRILRTSGFWGQS